MILVEAKKDHTGGVTIRVPMGRLNNAVVILWSNYNYDLEPPNFTSVSYPSVPVFRYGGSSGPEMTNIAGSRSYTGETQDLKIRIGITYAFDVTPSASDVLIYAEPLFRGYFGSCKAFSLSCADYSGAGGLTYETTSAYHSASSFLRRGGLTFGFYHFTYIQDTWYDDLNINGIGQTEVFDTAYGFGPGALAPVGHFWSIKGDQNHPSPASNIGITYASFLGATPLGGYLDIDNSKISTRPPLPGMI